MYQIGLLLLTGPFRTVVESISQYLKCANKSVLKRLYVKLVPEFSNRISKSEASNLRCLSNFIPLVYNKASLLCQNLDVRVLLSDSKKRKSNYDHASKFDVVLTNSKEEDQTITKYIDLHFEDPCSIIIKLNEGELIQSDISDCNFPSAEFPIYNTVCLGGTFDRLHNGHKVLLSEAALRATEKLIVGITDDVMLKKKILWELIEPIQKRIEEVTKFLLDVNPSLHYEVVPITDPYGPTITDPNINCLVVSAETRFGGEKVNSERKKRGMSQLTMYVVDLLENTDKMPGEEEKLSSSTIRIHLLGTSLKTAQATSNSLYTIFLQGQPMTGKSCISSYLQKHGASIINCSDIIKSILHNKHDRTLFLDKFSDCFSKDELIDYGKLVLHCLKDKERRQWIAGNLCQKVETEIKQIIQTYQKGMTKLVLIQDSVLLDGNLNYSDINEVWSTVKTMTEITKGLCNFYELSEEDATAITLSLPSNSHFIENSNRIFCNQWTSEMTEQQISRTWSDIRLKIQ